MVRRVFAATMLLGAATLAAAAGANERASAPTPKRGAASRRHRVQPALSIGTPSEGHLEGAIELQASPELRLRHPHGARYGLPRLIRLLERSAKRLSHHFPGATLLVADLSLKQGGDIAGHKSHESGRDADVAFQFVTADGRTVTPNELLTVTPDGTALENRAWHFDEARNWALVEAWVTDPSARIEHIFVVDHVRARLLRYARAKGTYLPTLHRAALAMKQPTRGASHDDHFHLRISCPPGQRSVCVQEARPEPGVSEAVYRRSTRRHPAAPRALVKARKERETTRR